MSSDAHRLVGDARARLEGLYREMLPAVFGYARSRLREAEAEDVTAEVFRAALNRINKDPSAELNQSWLLTVARNLIIDRWRRESRWEGRLDVLRIEAQEPRYTGPNDSIDRVLDALDTLTPDHRAVLIMRYVDRYTSREIADVLGRAPRAVDSLLARARVALIAAFDKAEA
jgi:RNA polymerase sigma-70 factor (ECF subfamily)